MSEKQRVGRFDPAVMASTIASMGGRAAQVKLTPEERSRRGRKAARTLGREGRAARARKGWETRQQKAQAAKAWTSEAFLPKEQDKPCVCHPGHGHKMPGGYSGKVVGCDGPGTAKPPADMKAHHEEINRIARTPAWARHGKPDPNPVKGTPVYDASTKERSQVTTIPNGTKPIGWIAPMPPARVLMPDFHPQMTSTAEEQAPKKPIKPGTNEAKVRGVMANCGVKSGRLTTTIAEWARLTTKETSRALNSLRAGGHVVSEGGRIKMWRLAP